MAFDILDEAYTRLRSTGPEFDDWLSNHGPMAAEALARHGHEDAIPEWLDSYSRRLESSPRASVMIDDWRTALGDARRLGDWLGWFDNELQDQAWTQVLQTWWPRLLPGIAAGATHGVIRVGHAVRVLREEGETTARIGELAQGLGYWAARWQAVPAATGPTGHLDAESAIAAVPTIPHQVGGIQSRLAQLEHVDRWPQAQQALSASADWEALLRDVVSAAVRRYATHAHGNAVLRTLPSLPPALWAPSAAAAWSASAAIHAAYASPTSAPQASHPPTAADAFDRAAQHGDEHVIKLADTALDTYSWTADPRALAAVETAAHLIDPL
jgi:hypothetical protein